MIAVALALALALLLLKVLRQEKRPQTTLKPLTMPLSRLLLLLPLQLLLLLHLLLLDLLLLDLLLLHLLLPPHVPLVLPGTCLLHHLQVGG